MSIPTDITYTGVSANFDINPASGSNFAIDLRTPTGVNSAINTIKGQMLDQDWTLTAEYLASTSLYAPGLVGSSVVGLSKVTTNWYGLTLQFYQLPEPNPTGLPGLLPGTFIYGMQADPGATQEQLLGLLALAMFDTCPEPFNISVGAGDTIFIIAIPGDGPALNDRHYGANVTAGFTFAGPTNGGGWELTSASSAEHSPVTVSLRKKDSRNYLSIDTVINGNECTEILLERRHNYVSVVSPYMWCLFRLNDGTDYSSGDIYVQYDNYWICAPEMDSAQRNHPDNPLAFAAFVLIRDRTSLNSVHGVTAINDSFYDGLFFPFDNDTGISPYLINSKYDAAGALVTTTDAPVQIQALMGLSQGPSEPLCIIGPAWDMFVTSKYHPLDELAFSRAGKLVIAYRSQQAPCEATLWLALN